MSQLFDQLAMVYESDKSITTSSPVNEAFMITRFLSLTPVGFFAANDLNRMQGLPEWAKLPFLKHCTPKQSAPRFKYPKKLTTKKKLSPKRTIALQKICNKYAVTDEHGLQIMALLEQQGVKLESS